MRRTIGADTPELFPPALGVPMSALVGSIQRDHDEVPDPGSDDVIAARAAVLLLATDVPNVVAG